MSIGLLPCLVFVGVSCTRIEGNPADTIIDGAIGTPLAALDKAKGLTAEEQARLNREAEIYDNLVTVALVITDGSETPSDVTEGPEFGCSDRIGFIKLSRASATNQVAVDALNTLFDLTDTTVSGLYNALAFSELGVEEIVMGDSGKVEVYLVGEVNSGGTCDGPRVIAQVEETIRRFHPDFKVLLNGSESQWRCLTDLSGLCQ